MLEESNASFAAIIQADCPNVQHIVSDQRVFDTNSLLTIPEESNKHRSAPKRSSSNVEVLASRLVRCDQAIGERSCNIAITVSR